MVTAMLSVPTVAAAASHQTGKLWTPPNTPLPTTKSVPGKSAPALAAAKPSFPAGQVWTPPAAIGTKAKPGQASLTLAPPAGASTPGAAAPRANVLAAVPAPAAGSDVQAGSLPVWLAPAAPGDGAAGAQSPVAKAPGGAAPQLRSEAAPTTPAAPAASGSVQVTLADQATAAAAGAPTGVIALSGDGAKPGSQLRVGVGLDQLGSYGGDFAQRASLVSLPACSLTTPQVPGCLTRTALPSHYDAKTKRLVADLTVPAAPAAAAPAPSGGVHPQALAAAPATAQGAPAVVGVVSGSSSGAGTYTATSLNPSTAWTAGGSSGAFTYSYPVAVPPTLGGTAPSLGLSYDSSSVDGRTSSTNSQASWVGGDGWDLNSGFVERQYTPCFQDGITGAGDECWGGANLTLSLAGHSGELVPDDASCASNQAATQEQSACAWHLKGDDGTKIEFLTGATNGTWNGSYIKVTDTSGTVYYFGLNHLPGADGKPTTLGADTQSAWTVPVYSPKAGDPCYNSTASQAWCQMAWRWNLDAVVDVHGNLTTYHYNAETNNYSRGAGQNQGSGTDTAYTRAGVLSEIDYGQLLSDQLGANGGYQSAAKVVFTSGERCVTSTAACDPSQRTQANAANWPDVPLDQQCDQNSCSNASPSFWTSKWLNTIATQVRSNGSFRTVDSYQLNHVFVQAQNSSENTQIPWLTSVQHTAQDNQNGQSPVTLPPVSFTWELLANRVDGLSPARPDYNRPRLTIVTTEAGGTISADYQVPITTGTVPTGDQPWCSRVVNQMPATADTDTRNCFNVKWYPPNSTVDTTPTDDWFQRYPVSTVTVDPKLAAGDKPQVTTYTYGPAAWHHNDATLVDPKSRTWDQFRGYAWVTTVSGSPNDSTPSQSTTYYYQGMNGDLTATGTRTATVAGLNSGQVISGVSDDDWFAGQILETDTYSAAGGPVSAFTVHTGSGPVVTATHVRSGGLPNLLARYAATSTTTTSKALKADGKTWQTSSEVLTTDPANANRVTSSLSSADGTADVCVRPTYATSANAQLTKLVAQTVAVSGANACSAVPTAANTVSGSRNLFDGQGFGGAGSQGEITSIQVLDHYDSSGNPQFSMIGTNGYDSYGRVVVSTDTTSVDSAHPGGAATTTAFGSANPGELPATITVTAPAPAGAPDAASGRTTTTTLDMARTLPLVVTDPNGQTVTKSYDAMGRLTAAWPAGRTTAQNASATFSYAVNGTGGASTVTSNTLQNDDQHYSTSIAIMDGLGRTIQTQATPAISGYNGRMVSDTFYDSQGHVWRSDAAFYNDASAPSTTWFNMDPSVVPNSTYTTFDGLGRPVQADFRAYGVVQTNASTMTKYPGVDRTDVTPPSGGTPTSTVLDARGRAAQLWQYRTPTATGNPGDADVTTYTNTAAGLPATRVDAAGNTWSYGYDQRNRQITASDPDTGTTTQSYDTSGHLATTTDARGQSLAYSYDLLGRTTGEFSGTSTTDATKQLTAFSYDTVPGGKGEPASSTRYVGGASGSAYTSAVVSYDAAYRPTSTQVTIPGSEVGQTTPFTYSQQTGYNPITGAMIWQNRPAVGDVPYEMLDYSYDARGLMVSYGQQNQNMWSYDVSNAYDAYGRPTRTTVNPWGTQVVVTNSYDEPTGRQVYQFVDAQPNPTGAVQQTKYSYNAAGQVTSITGIPNNTPASTDTQCFTYDYLGRLTTAWSDTGSVTMAPQPSVGSIGSCANSTPTSGAQAPNRTTVGGPSAYWQSYGYDLTGNRTQLVQHDAGGDTTKDVTTNQSFNTGKTNSGDGNGGPHALTYVQNVVNGTANPQSGSDQYDAAGNTTKIIKPGGTRNLFGGWTLASGQSITSNSVRLSMQADGNLVLMSLRTGAVVWNTGTYNHPGAYATMQTDGNFVVYDSGNHPLWASGTYPNAGAYLSLQDDGNLVVYKSAQALSQNPIWSSSTWNGTDSATAYGNATTFTWDAEGKLASETQGGQTTSYVYDASGNLLIRRSPGSNTVILGGGSDELTYNTTTKAAPTGTRYYPMPGGVTLVRTAKTNTYEIADSHGTNTLSLDATSLAQTRNPVDPFGNPRATSTATNNWAGDKGFVGGTTDSTTGFTNLGAREYQSGTGRFLSADPLLSATNPQQWNGYAYSGNDPVNSCDPTGRIAVDDNGREINTNTLPGGPNYTVGINYGTPLTQNGNVIYDGNGVPHVLADEGDSTSSNKTLDYLNHDLQTSGNLYDPKTGSGSKYLFQDDSDKSRLENKHVLPTGGADGGPTVAGTTADYICVTWSDGKIVNVETVDNFTSNSGKYSEIVNTSINKMRMDDAQGAKQQTQKVVFTAQSQEQAEAVAALVKDNPNIRVVYLDTGFDSRPVACVQAAQVGPDGPIIPRTASGKAIGKDDPPGSDDAPRRPPTAGGDEDMGGLGGGKLLGVFGVVGDLLWAKSFVDEWDAGCGPDTGYSCQPPPPA
ncbi:RHS repeat-associated core domain-containing protein [Kitasatospora sp. LaBMicrA B282]|uniref:RHS repeat-associated core domain-containing protein n=1 Tax=Kitasatospora sp. LaBMicrA B282 TaxID=3420949 RepID=UPI003D0DFF9A